MLEGCYISADGRFTAELRKAGHYADAGCKLVRHYAIRMRGESGIVALPRTLKEAEKYL